jgi:hypothetical protein
MPSSSEKPLVRFRPLVQLTGNVLPRYERDAGPLTAAQLREARSLVSQNCRPTSSLFGTTERQRVAKAKKKAKA